MAARVHRGTRARAHGRRLLAELLADAERGRLSAGLTHAEIGRSIGLTGWQVGRILRAETSDVGLVRMAELLATVGLELGARAYPFGDPIRDAAQLGLLERLRRRLHPSLRWRAEVPVVEALIGTSDRRAWDAAIDGPGWGLRVEAETRVRDLQEVQRRVALKQRDGAIAIVLLVLADSAHNRRICREHAASLAGQFPGTARATLQALREGRSPAASTVILL